MAANDTKPPAPADEKKLAYYEASQWSLIRRRFSKHKVALWMAYVVIVLYLLCLNCEFFAAYEPNDIHKDWVNMPPQYLKFGLVDGFPRFYVNPYTRVRNPITLAERYYPDESKRVPVRFFARGPEWNFLGLIPTTRHFYGVDPEAVGGVTSSGQAPLRLTVTDNPAEDGTQYSLVTLADGASARKLDLRPGDTLRFEGPDSSQPGQTRIQDYHIRHIVAAEGESGGEAIVLDYPLAEKISTPVEAEAWRVHTVFLLGTGPLGQDLVSRILHGGRVSLLTGLTGVIISFVLGISLGGISGYFGGRVDMTIQRLAEILMTVPHIPIWLAMAAAIPKGWTSLQVYFAMTLILACMSWTGLCRVVRGKLLSLREEDYARAAILAGASQKRVIFVHLIPNFVSHLIASLTLSIPGMILAETSLSFLGLGLRPPIVSWGVLLNQAQKLEVVENQPWLLLPAGMVVLAVLAFNFVGEGLRDAADPYST
jgi:ABC-type dipeptide/oligopeptide/nickel transport system permease subunit